MKQYVIGIDYGTLSARALLVNLADGSEAAESEFLYPHGVMTDADFNGRSLDVTDAFQHPQDYLDALRFTVGDLLDKAEVSSSEVAGIGIDFTSSTILPVGDNKMPLCFDEAYRNEPQAYVKLWKHHSAQREADEINALAAERGESWLDIYGGKISSEWLFPKLIETLRKAPEVYHRADRFVEAVDWLTCLLTGEEVISACTAGYKGLWSKDAGFPSNEFWGAVDSRLADVIGSKIRGEILPTGTRAGVLNEQGAALIGLEVGCAVAVPIIDAHAALPASGIVSDKKLMMIIGTSTCHIVMSRENHPVPGICGSVADGVIAGYTAYEAGQSCVGDSFDWYMKNCLPASYEEAAKAEGKSIFAYMDEKAAKSKVGESGILILDWWNGNRTPYVDAELTGTILGLTLKTTPEEIYRGMIESTAYGTKVIVDLFTEHGVEIDEIYAAGGISQKNQLLMQIYADVLGLPIKAVNCRQAGAKGSAVMAAAACGYFDSVEAAAERIADREGYVYVPDPENTKAYEKIYCQYRELAEYFAKKNDVMKKLK